MKDEQIENLLRESWSPRTPEGMKQRVLTRSRHELSRRRVFYAAPRWQASLAAAVLLVIVLSGLSEHGRQARLSALIDAGGGSGAVSTAWIVDRQASIAGLIAGTSDDAPLSGRREGESL